MNWYPSPLGHCAMRSRYVLGTIAVGLSTSVCADKGDLYVIRADYVQTIRESNAEPARVVEEGSYYLIPDGRVRVDKLVRGERVSEILLPGDAEKVLLNHDKRIAVRGPIRIEWNVPSLQQEPATIREEKSLQRLGRRAVGPLILDGHRQVENVEGVGEFVTEAWVAAPESIAYGAPPRFIESTLISPDGTVHSKKLTAVSRTLMSSAVVMIPATYKQTTVTHPPGYSVLFGPGR